MQIKQRPVPRVMKDLFHINIHKLWGFFRHQISHFSVKFRYVQRKFPSKQDFPFPGRPFLTYIALAPFVIRCA